MQPKLVTAELVISASGATGIIIEGLVLKVKFEKTQIPVRFYLNERPQN